MKYYTNSRLFVIRNLGFFFRHKTCFGVFKGVLRLILVLLFARPYKQSIEKPYFFLKNSRLSGDRFYGIVQGDSAVNFFKADANNTFDLARIDAEKLIPYSFKYTHLSYTEWQKYCFKGELYHGDANLSNILSDGRKVVVVDWENIGQYHIDYANLDYIMSEPGINSKLRSNRLDYYDLFGLTMMLGIHDDRLLEVLHERVKNIGCNISLTLLDL